jgi:mediator of RNA polymerase II transcription subunit 16, fungi type
VASHISLLTANRKIAWSKSGCVAYITPDGYAVNLRVFSRDPATGKWDLSEDAQLEIPHGHDDFPYVHLSWSHLGQDLAVVDAAGHVLLFSPQMVLDKMGLQRVDPSHPEAEMDAVVGMHWLAVHPHEQKVCLFPIPFGK